MGTEQEGGREGVVALPRWMLDGYTDIFLETRRALQLSLDFDFVSSCLPQRH